MLKIQRLIVVLFVLLWAYMPSIYACTVWGSVGDVNKRLGLLLTKNRETDQLGLEKLMVVHSKGVLEYLGLFYNTDPKNHQDYPYLSAGINRAGLVVVNNSIATIDVDNRVEKETGVMKKLLANYDSTDAILRDAKILFSVGSPNHLLVGDSKQLLSIEIGESGAYNIKSTLDGYLYHTNHFTSTDVLKHQNDPRIVYPSTHLRYEWIGRLLKKDASVHVPYTFNEYLRWATQQENGFENSIFRSLPHPTVATWIVSIPEKQVKNTAVSGNDAPFVYIRFTSSLQGYAVYQLTLDNNFWEKPQFKNVHVVDTTEK